MIITYFTTSLLHHFIIIDTKKGQYPMSDTVLFYGINCYLTIIFFLL